MTTLHISEIFCSVQGEGGLTGVPSVFIRTVGCNLRCRWCDTPESSWEPRGERMSVDSILERIAAFGVVTHVVLTGGEPLLAKGVEVLAARLAERGYHITVETAGTILQELPADLWSISPKLSNSTPDASAGVWRERHEAARLAPDVIRALMASADYQLKFVASAPDDLAEIEQLVAAVAAEPSRVMLMPEGVSVEALDRGAEWLVPACIERGWRFCDRLQIRLFGDTRGT